MNDCRKVLLIISKFGKKLNYIFKKKSHIKDSNE